jgi:hypothetical protein
MNEKTQNNRFEMNETRLIYDPVIGKHVQISDNLTDRLRGRYAIGPKLENGEPEFGWREYDVPPIQIEAAKRIENLETVLFDAQQALINEGMARDKAEALAKQLQERLDAIARVDNSLAAQLRVSIEKNAVLAKENALLLKQIPVVNGIEDTSLHANT